MSEAETHYGIDLELLDDNEEVVAQGIPAASPLQSHVQRKIASETATTKTKKKTTGSQAEDHFPMPTATTFVQTPDMDICVTDYLLSQPLSAQVNVFSIIHTVILANPAVRWKF